MLIGEAKCIDDHFLCLIRLVVMSVLKSEERGEYIHIKRFELVGHFFQGHGIIPICRGAVCDLRSRAALNNTHSRLASLAPAELARAAHSEALTGQGPSTNSAVPHWWPMPCHSCECQTAACLPGVPPNLPRY